MTDLSNMSYEEMMAARTYAVLRCHRDADGVWQKPEASGLSLQAARNKVDELEKAYAVEHPEKNTSWTMDLFIVDLEQRDEINNELMRRRLERCK